MNSRLRDIALAKHWSKPEPGVDGEPRFRRDIAVTIGLIAASLIFLVGMTIWLTVASTHAYAPNSDGATVFLEGAAVGHGQVLLHGWSLSLDSFWTVDVLFYAFGISLFGAQPLLMHLVPAFLEALCLLVGIFLVGSAQTRRASIFATVLLVTILGLPGHSAAYFLLQGPWHVATVLYCLIAALLLSRRGFSWRVPLATVILALGLTGDFQMLALGIIPVGLAGVFAIARCRSWRAGAPQVVAALGAGLLALSIRAIAVAMGTFQVHESHHTVGLSQLARDLGHFVNWFSAIYGVHPGPIAGRVVLATTVGARVVILALIMAALLFALFQMLRAALLVPGTLSNGSVSFEAQVEERSWRIDDLLVCMVLGSIGTFGLLTLSNNPSYARYLDAVVIFSAVLGARLFGRLAGRASSGVLRFAAVALAVLVLLSGLGAVRDARVATPVAPTVALEHYLVQNDLRSGVGDYWAASIVTVDTKGAVVIRPVVANPRHEIVPDGRQADIGWYLHRRFEFLIYMRAPHGHVNRATAQHTFGPPEKIIRIGQYFVMTWTHPISLRPTPYPS